RRNGRQDHAPPRRPRRPRRRAKRLFQRQPHRRDHGRAEQVSVCSELHATIESHNMLVVETYVDRSKIDGFGVFVRYAVKKGSLMWEFVEGFDLELNPAAF